MVRMNILSHPCTVKRIKLGERKNYVKAEKDWYKTKFEEVMPIDRPIEVAGNRVKNTFFFESRWISHD